MDGHPSVEKTKWRKHVTKISGGPDYKQCKVIIGEVSKVACSSLGTDLNFSHKVFIYLGIRNFGLSVPIGGGRI